MSAWDTLIAWAKEYKPDTPLVLHIRIGDDPYVEGERGEARRLGGLPYSRPFLKYLDGRLSDGALAREVREIRRRASSRMDRRVCELLEMVLAGEHDMRRLRKRLRVGERMLGILAVTAVQSLQRSLDGTDDKLVEENDLLAERQRLLRGTIIPASA